MLGLKRKKRGLYYLLPGMNRANREKQKIFLRWAILVGLLFAAVFGYLIWYLNTPHIKYVDF